MKEVNSVQCAVCSDRQTQLKHNKFEILCIESDKNIISLQKLKRKKSVENAIGKKGKIILVNISIKQGTHKYAK